MWTRNLVLATSGPESRVRGCRSLWRPSSGTDDRNMRTRIVISWVSESNELSWTTPFPAHTKSTSTDPERLVVVA